ncbi:hypothetical protein T4A_12375, partial [Trichinella pseudospiralis]
LQWKNNNEKCNSELLNSFEKLPAEMNSSVLEIMSQDTTGSEVKSESPIQHWVFPNKEELQVYMFCLNMVKKDERKWRTKDVVKIRYRCREIRKFPKCGAYFTAKCEADGRIESYSGVVHNHSYRKPTTRISSPARAKVFQCLNKGTTDAKY